MPLFFGSSLGSAMLTVEASTNDTVGVELGLFKCPVNETQYSNIANLSDKLRANTKLLNNKPYSFIIYNVC